MGSGSGSGSGRQSTGLLLDMPATPLGWDFGARDLVTMMGGRSGLAISSKRGSIHSQGVPGVLAGWRCSRAMWAGCCLGRTGGNGALDGDEDSPLSRGETFVDANSSVVMRAFSFFKLHNIDYLRS